MYLASRMSRFDLQGIVNRRGNNSNMKWYKLLVDDVTFSLLEGNNLGVYMQNQKLLQNKEFCDGT